MLPFCKARPASLASRPAGQPASQPTSNSMQHMLCLTRALTCCPAGAAPGGWTAYLAQRMQRVIAIDPAALEQRVLDLPNVVHLRCKANEAVESGELARLVGLVGLPAGGLPSGGSPNAAALAGTAAANAGTAASVAAGACEAGMGTCSSAAPPATAAGAAEAVGVAGARPPQAAPAGVGEGGPVAVAAGADLVVCDMNHHPRDVLPLLPHVLGFLRPGGRAIVTLKFFGKRRQASSSAAGSAAPWRLSGPEYSAVLALFLFRWGKLLPLYAPGTAEGWAAALVQRPAARGIAAPEWIPCFKSLAPPERLRPLSRPFFRHHHAPASSSTAAAWLTHTHCLHSAC